MKRLVTTAAIALAVSGALVSAVPAQARPGNYGGGHSYHGGGGYGSRGYSDYGHRGRGRFGGYRGYGSDNRGYYRDDTGLILGIGILGLALGAAVASDGGRDYDRYDTGPDGYLGRYDDYEGYDGADYGYPSYGY